LDFPDSFLIKLSLSSLVSPSKTPELASKSTFSLSLPVSPGAKT